MIACGIDVVENGRSRAGVAPNGPNVGLGTYKPPLWAVDPSEFAAAAVTGMVPRLTVVPLGRWPTPVAAWAEA